jgi:LPS sulfotransferase NodH
MEFTYEQSPHEKTLYEVFTDAPEVAPHPSRLRCVLLGFVNRSGSNYLADLLRSTGKFVGLDESLNDYSFRELAPAYGTKSFAEYLKRLHWEQASRPGQIWGMKVGWMQLTMLLRTRAIPNLLDPSLVLIRRRDVIAQAISYFIATKTQQWTTSDEAVVDRNKVVYDGQDILDIIQHIMQDYSMFDQIVTCTGLPYGEIFYEDLLDSPEKIICNIARTLCGHAFAVAPDTVRVKIQRDVVDQQFKERFLDDLSELHWNIFR